jgi:hypothetical protein
MLENSIKDVLNSEIITSDMIASVALDALRACVCAVTTAVTAAKRKRCTESDKDLETVEDVRCRTLVCTSDLEPEQLAESTQRPTIVRPPIAFVVESELAVKQAVDNCVETLLRKLERFELLAGDLGFKNDRRMYTEQNQIFAYRKHFFNDCAKDEGFKDARQKYIAYIMQIDRPTREEEDFSETNVYDCDSCMHAQCCEWV